jgi:hypothetical protein
MERTHLAEDMYQWTALITTAMKRGSIKGTVS